MNRLRLFLCWAAFRRWYTMGNSNGSSRGNMRSSSSASVLQLSPKAGVLSSRLFGGIPKPGSYYQVIMSEVLAER
jgi:hypothetical protein